MRVLRGSAASWPREEAATALAIGVFDGLHSGHRAVLAELRSHADRIGVIPGVVTFDPHPLSVVAPEHAPALITDIEQRLELLQDLGIGLAAVVPFDAATRAWSPSDFALGLLTERLRTRVVLVGEDFRFDATGRATLACCVNSVRSGVRNRGGAARRRGWSRIVERAASADRVRRRRGGCRRAPAVLTKFAAR